MSGRRDDRTADHSSPGPENLSSSLRRNIEVLAQRRNKEAAEATAQERLAEAIAAFTGSMTFVYLHLVLYAAWILVNVGLLPGLPKFDPSFVILAMEASVEAIFLSTFVVDQPEPYGCGVGQAGRY